MAPMGTVCTPPAFVLEWLGDANFAKRADTSSRLFSDN